MISYKTQASKILKFDRKALARRINWQNDVTSTLIFSTPLKNARLKNLTKNLTLGFFSPRVDHRKDRTKFHIIHAVHAEKVNISNIIAC